MVEAFRRQQRRPVVVQHLGDLRLEPAVPARLRHEPRAGWDLRRPRRGDRPGRYHRPRRLAEPGAAPARRRRACGVLANTGGVPLAFAFIASIGNSGVVTEPADPPRVQSLRPRLLALLLRRARRRLLVFLAAAHHPVACFRRSRRCGASGERLRRRSAPTRVPTGEGRATGPRAALYRHLDGAVHGRLRRLRHRRGADDRRRPARAAGDRPAAHGNVVAKRSTSATRSASGWSSLCSSPARSTSSCSAARRGGCGDDRNRTFRYVTLYAARAVRHHPDVRVGPVQPGGRLPRQALLRRLHPGSAQAGLGREHRHLARSVVRRGRGNAGAARPDDHLCPPAPAAAYARCSRRCRCCRSASRRS